MLNTKPEPRDPGNEGSLLPVGCLPPAHTMADIATQIAVATTACVFLGRNCTINVCSVNFQIFFISCNLGHNIRVIMGHNIRLCVPSIGCDT